MSAHAASRRRNERAHDQKPHRASPLELPMDRPTHTVDGQCRSAISRSRHAPAASGSARLVPGSPRVGRVPGAGADNVPARAVGRRLWRRARRAAGASSVRLRPRAGARPARARELSTDWDTLFDELYLRTYAPLQERHDAEAQALAAVRLAGVEAPADVLGSACGYGRHAIPAREGLLPRRRRRSLRGAPRGGAPPRRRGRVAALRPGRLP